MSQLRTKPLDRRYLNARDRSDWNNSGAAGKQQQALARVKMWRGAQAYEANRPMNTKPRKGFVSGDNPGLNATANFSPTIELQHNRLRAKGSEKQRMKELRPEKFKPQ